MISWIGQHIWDFISRFRNDVYLEDLADPGSDTDKFLVVDANDKVGYRTGAEVLSDIGGGSGGIAFDGSTTNGVLTYKDADEATVEADLTYNSTTQILQSSSSSSTGPYITLHNTDGGSGSSQFNFSNGASGDDGDSLGIINWGGQDDGGNAVVTWAQLNAKISDASDTTEEGEMNLTVIAQGSNRNGLNITANGSNVVDTTLGYGAASTTTIAGGISIGGHTVNDIDVAGEFVDSDEHLMTAAAINDQFGGGGGVTADPFSTTVIKILPHQFMINDDAGRPAMIEDDTSNTLGVRCAGTTDEMYAWQKIPTGYKVTHVRVNASASTSSAVSVRSYNYQTGADNAVSATTGDLNANIDITDIPSSATQDLVIKVSPASASTMVFGALVTIATI